MRKINKNIYALKMKQSLKEAEEPKKEINKRNKPVGELINKKNKV